MVNIDTVYQKVLALANKEQRGYITPQEFNLMADKAQMEIFDTYFYDLKMAYQKPKTNINHGDEMELLHKKMYPFKATTNVLVEGGSTGTIGIPGNSYYIDSISTSDVNNAITGREVTELNQKEYINAIAHPLLAPSFARPVYIVTGNTISIFPVPASGTNIYYRIDYWKKPSTPNWGYVVVKGRALYNGSSSASQHFSLHRSEEEALVTRILQLAGVIIQKPGIVEVAMAEKANTKQDQND